MDLDQLKYKFNETLKQKGPMWFVWRGLAVLFVLWVIWPESKAVVHEVKVSQEAEAASGERKWHKTPEAKRDLRKILTTTQSTFYWDSFNWMMEYGIALKPRSFESKIINLLLVMDESVQTEKNITCRSFREKLVVSAQANTREGVACKRGVADWCKQVEGEKVKCRTQQPTGLDAFTTNAFDMHNLNVRLNRGLRF